MAGRSKPRVIQAGAIVFRAEHGAARILLVQAKKSAEWVFPKGHVEDGESFETAALREASEEGGIGGVVIGPVGRSLEFSSGTEPVRVHYFLVYARRDTPSPEGRQKRWCSLDEALAALPHPDARALLEAARSEIAWWTRPAERPASAPDFRDLMKAEFEHVASSLRSNEENGEKRVSAFLAVSSAVSAALAFVLGGETAFDPPRQVAVLFALAVLLVFGYGTIRRIVVRNAATDRHKRQLGRIRQYFLDGLDDPRRLFLPFPPFEHAWRKPALPFTLGSGGWFETVVVLESVLAGGFVALLCWSLTDQYLVMRASARLPVAIAGGVLAFAGTWFELVRRAKGFYVSKMREAPAKAGDEP